MKLSIAVMLLCFSCFGSERAQWLTLSSKLSGHSEFVRRQTLKKLQTIPDIQNILETELQGKHVFHALEVISAMRLTKSLPRLKEFATLESTGVVFLTINSLTASDNLSDIAEFYKATWENDRKTLFNPALVVVLDTMAQMALCVSEKSLLSIWENRPAEVRLAVLDYIDVAPQSCGSYPALSEIAKKNHATQVRERAVGR